LDKGYDLNESPELAMLGLSGPPQLIRQIDKQLRRLPDWLRRYVIVLAALIGGCALAVLLLHTVGDKSRVVISLLGDLVFLGAAWMGYGPGVLALAVILFIVPRVLLPDRPSHVDLGQFGLLTIISLLVSRISSSKRRTEASLRQLAGELDIRVQERTQELQRNEQRMARLAAIVESSDDAIVGKTLDGTVTSWNSGAEALYGYGADEMVGRSTAILSPPENSGDLSTILLLIRSGDVIRNFETVRLHKDGRRIDVSLTVSPVRDSQGVIEGASTIARDMTAQRRAQQALEDSEHRYRLLFENNPQPMWVYDQETLAFLTINDTAVHNYGYTREEFLRMTLKDIRPKEDIPKLLEATAVPTSQFNREGSWRHRKKDGTVINVEIAAHPFAFGERPACLVLATDVTERIKLEEQFRQAQRMESVGQLAGGIAHDFNNLLTVINGYAEMVLDDPTASLSIGKALQEILHAGERAAGLTRQLLAFSRRQVIQPAVININTIVSSTETLLRRLIGEDIKFVTKLAPDLGLVLADPGQIQQIVMNLAVNSRDAMPNGGSLHIETSNVTLEEGYRSEHQGVRAGPHVMLAVTDSGTGISPEIRARIFEPFFTTKELGKGTGLGLATVYGMVKQGGGWIWVYSEPGQGTTFKIYFPRTDQPLSLMTPATRADLRGNETILVVEDQLEVRTLALIGLAAHGYSVHGVTSGKEALAFCREFTGDIDLVVTDVVMQEMNGREVARQVGQLKPKARILFISGYTTDVIAHRGVLETDVEYLQKPFTPDSLARKIRKVLAT
jgi:two-component system, cell cycle sensor histidine kinase and response regulator CckA